MVQGASCRVQVAGCRVQVAGCRLQVAGCREKFVSILDLSFMVGGLWLHLDFEIQASYLPRCTMSPTSYPICSSGTPFRKTNTPTVKTRYVNKPGT